MFKTPPALRPSPTTRDAVNLVRSPASSIPHIFWLTHICPLSFHPLNSIACGKSASGFTAAMNQLSFGSAPGLGAGDACGRCFAITGSKDPYSPSYTGPFHSIVVKVTDLCPISGNQEWCGQTISNPTNQHGASTQCVISSVEILIWSWMLTRTRVCDVALIFVKTLEEQTRSSHPVSLNAPGSLYDSVC